MQLRRRVLLCARMRLKVARLERERKTIEAMIVCYCRGVHGSKAGPCAECGELLEYAVVYGDYKGIHKQQVRQALASGQDVIMRIDVQGAATIRRLAPQAVFIFLCPSSLDELEQRLCARGTETAESLARKLAMIPREMAEWPKFDYVVLNPNNALDDAVEHIKAIILAERCRVKQRRIEL